MQRIKSRNKPALRFELPEAFVSGAGYELLPFRETVLPNIPGHVLLTSIVGEYAFLRVSDFEALKAGAIDKDSSIYRSLRTRQIICDADRGPFFEGLEAQQRTRKLLGSEDPALHIFVVTLRCNHRCHYCQVSPQLASAAGYDMSDAVADAAIERVFESKSKHLTIEFQGGEAGLAFDRVRYVVEQARRRTPNDRTLRFVLTSTLHLLTEGDFAFCRDYQIELSTSLDGPMHLHNANRILPNQNSYSETIQAIERARSICGHSSVSALSTVTRQSLPYAREIIDTFVSMGFDSISLRPLSPFGFAVKSERKLGYPMKDFLGFYREALAYLIELNLRGIRLEESYASLLLTKILTPFPTNYVDLQSPSACGSGVLVYNYDGGIYVSDEGRMLAEMGDKRFRMGSVFDSQKTLRNSSAMELVRRGGTAEELPGCSTCAFVPYCGADPVFHVATQNDPIGDRALSEFCSRHMGMFQILFEYLTSRDPDVMRVFLSWINMKSTVDVTNAGYLC